MNVDRILPLLNGVKPHGANKWRACCPGHNSDNPSSLALMQMNDGRVLLHCFVGCTALEVVNSVGLQMQDLFPEGSLGEFKGWQSLERDQAARIEKKKYDALSHERAILEQANGERKAGHRLTREDMEVERQAYLRVRNANA